MRCCVRSHGGTTKNKTMWEIKDENGVIHTGDAKEMYHAWNVMRDPDSYSPKENLKYGRKWSGSLSLKKVKTNNKK